MGTIADRPAQSTIRRRVSKGIALLDEKGPENWRDRIDLDTLDVGELAYCPLGQVYGDGGEDYAGFGKGKQALFGVLWGLHDETVLHGFEGVGIYSALTEEWKRRLSK